MTACKSLHLLASFVGLIWPIIWLIIDWACGCYLVCPSAAAGSIDHPLWTCMPDQVPRRIQRWCSSAFGGLLGSSQPRRQVLPSHQAVPSASRAGPSQPQHVCGLVASSLLSSCPWFTCIFVTCTWNIGLAWYQLTAWARTGARCIIWCPSSKVVIFQGLQTAVILTSLLLCQHSHSKRTS